MEAIQNNFEFINKVDWTFAMYKCLYCNRIDLKRISDMRKCETACECRHDRLIKKWKARANEFNFNLLNRCTDNNYALYECLTCSANNEFQIGAMNIGNVKCSNVECNDSKSHAQKSIERFMLDNYKVELHNEVSFNDLRSDIGVKLRFDIGIYIKDALITLVEYDGEQHFKDNSFFGNDRQRLVLHDRMKDEYCLYNNIPLLRINYLEFKDTELWHNKLINHMLNYNVES